MDRLKDKPTRKNKKTARKPLKKPLAGINHLERIMGVEPTTSAWEANVLPINYIRISRIYYIIFGQICQDPGTPLREIPAENPEHCR